MIPLYLTTDKIWEKLGSAFTIQRTFFCWIRGYCFEKILKVENAFHCIRNFRKQKSTAIQKFLWKIFSLLVRTFARKISTVCKTPFTYLEFQRGEIQPLAKISSEDFLFTYYRSWQGTFCWFLKKYFLLLSSTALKSKMPNLRWKNIWAKEKRTGFSACPSKRYS